MEAFGASAMLVTCRENTAAPNFANYSRLILGFIFVSLHACASECVLFGIWSNSSPKKLLVNCYNAGSFCFTQCCTYRILSCKKLSFCDNTHEAVILCLCFFRIMENLHPQEVRVGQQCHRTYNVFHECLK